MRALAAMALVSATIAFGNGSPERLSGSPERLALRTSESDVARSASLSGERYDVRTPRSASLSGERYDVRTPRSASLSGERHDVRTPRSASLSGERYDVRVDTSKGAIVIAVHRDWAPRGADRFHELVASHYFDDSRFFRVVKGQWAQFGIAGDPALAKAWRSRTFPDDPRGQSNTRGRVAFAFAVANGRTTQVYISLRDNSYQDEQGFVPFGEVVEGMDVADALNSEYGETAGGGIRAGRQQPLFDSGNAFLDRAFPRLDRLVHASVLP